MGVIPVLDNGAIFFGLFSASSTFHVHLCRIKPAASLALIDLNSE